MDHLPIGIHDAQVRRALGAYGRADAVRADQDVPEGGGAVGEGDGDAVGGGLAGADLLAGLGEGGEAVEEDPPPNSLRRGNR
jgi:hypothetical protein